MRHLLMVMRIALDDSLFACCYLLPALCRPYSSAVRARALQVISRFSMYRCMCGTAHYACQTINPEATSISLCSEEDARGSECLEKR
ncbi:hypothetical protein BJ912DRAFT_986520 [Pholiota molesta]|nr:hypothetical protein BJ912DRAFT_986520 [Pholiota molesta]